MTFDAIWNQLRSKQTKLDNADATIEFKPQNLKQLLRQVYEQGQRSSQQPAQPEKFDPFKSIFR